MITAHATKLRTDTTSYGRTRLTVGDYALVIVPRTVEDRSVWSATRLYGAVDTLGGELGELFDANERRPVTRNGQDDFGSDAERDAHMKEYRSLKRQLIAHVKARVNEVFEQFAAADTKLFVRRPITLKFSKSAGCTMCPCSPGFVLDTTVVYAGEPVDLWLERVTSEIEPTRKLNPSTDVDHANH